MTRHFTPSIGLFGFGAFGRMIARSLPQGTLLRVCDPGVTEEDAGMPLVPMQEVARCDILILAVPLHAMEGLLGTLAPLLRPGQLVMDVCSVKVEPARIMASLLPDTVDVLATHPMFGPVGGAGEGARVVLCPVRGDGWRHVAAALRRQGLKVILTTPEEHDRQAALTQGITHLLGHALAQMGPAPVIRTRSYDMMMEAFGMVSGDAPGVFEAVTRGNPHFAGFRMSFRPEPFPEIPLAT